MHADLFKTIEQHTPDRDEKRGQTMVATRDDERLKLKFFSADLLIGSDHLCCGQLHFPALACTV